MEPLTVRVHGEPKGQPRPRAFAMKGKARMYDPGTAEGWKASVAHAITTARGDQPPMDGAVCLRATFIMPRPKYLLKRSSPPGRLPHTSKPDADNLLKAVMDAMTQIGVWRDDAQVSETLVLKRYAAISEVPGAEIVISPTSLYPL